MHGCSEGGWSLSQSDIDFSAPGIIREWRSEFSRDLTSAGLSSKEGGRRLLSIVIRIKC